MNENGLAAMLGNIDIYLFDQLLKGRFDDCRTVLDAGCGSGRNLHWFLQNGFDVYGADADAQAVAAVRQLAGQLAPGLPAANFVHAPLEAMPFDSDFFGLVICSAVLHFAASRQQFETMLQGCWRVLKPGGYFFCRLASSIGIEGRVTPLGNGRYLLPDGSERYLVDEAALLHYTGLLGGQLYEPIKTTNVQGMRCMTTWCVRKG